jgi:tetratricopeptide (TPR) repeat protein
MKIKKQVLFALFFGFFIFSAIPFIYGQSSANNNANLYHERGLEHQNRGETEKAIAAFTRAISFDSRFADAYNSRGFLYFEMRDMDSAITDFSTAIKLAPRKSFAYNFRGSAYAMKREYDKAIADWEMVLKLDPENTNTSNLIKAVKQLKGTSISSDASRGASGEASR